eukprot:6032688-Alexandrium_andersonii.AAC.1
MEEPPVGESESNGLAERAAPEIQGQVRTLRNALEARYPERMAGDSPMWPWMVRHAGALISRYRRGKYGKAAYGRIQGA